MTALEIPELAGHEGSWVVTFPDGRVRETFIRSNAAGAVQMGCTVETIGTYLGRINREIKAQQG